MRVALELGVTDPEDLLDALEQDLAGWSDRFIECLGPDAVRTLVEASVVSMIMTDLNRGE
jgi:hypothetical protein